MGDHRFSFKAEFEMHGVKDKIDLGWHNWDGGLDGIDSRIMNWLEAAVAKAFARYDANVAAYFEEQNKEQREKDERAEFERIKQKYG